MQALGCGLACLGHSTDERDAGAILEAFEDVRQDEVRGGAGNLVACCAQAHLQEGPVEADGVHAGKRAEVGVQEGPVVQPRGRVPSSEHTLCHRVERGVGREGADRTALLRSAFVADTWSEHRCYEDLTGIYNYYIGYRNARTNEVLSRWMDMNVSNPPPTYAMSGRVYLLRMADGTHAALLFRNYMNAAGAKGFVTLDYIYPY